MNVQSLCLVSSMPRYPQALQELPMVCFLGLTCYKKHSILLDPEKKHNQVLMVLGLRVQML